MDRLAVMLSFKVPEGHVEGTHGGDRHARATKVHGVAIHLLPKAFGFERVFADQQFTQAASDVVRVRSVDHGFYHLGRRVGFADAFQPGVGFHAYEHRVLAAGGFVGNRVGAENLGR